MYSADVITIAASHEVCIRAYADDTQTSPVGKGEVIGVNPQKRNHIFESYVLQAGMRFFVVTFQTFHL